MFPIYLRSNMIWLRVNIISVALLLPPPNIVLYGLYMYGVKVLVVVVVEINFVQNVIHSVCLTL